MKQIVAISGSLRAGSSNEKILLAASKLAGTKVQVTLWLGLAGLPYFNPDLDNDRLPVEVKEFRTLVGKSDGLLISSPEYAHGVPGALKNALDWLVPSTEFPGKPVVLICGGEFAPFQLEETLKTMSAKILKTVVLNGPALRKAFDDQGELVDESITKAILECLALF